MQAALSNGHYRSPGTGSLLSADGRHPGPAAHAVTRAGVLRDLALDQFIAAVVVGHDEERDLLVDLFSRPVGSAAIALYRQETFTDLDDRSLLECVTRFSAAMRRLRARLAALSRMTSRRRSRGGWLLTQAAAYCSAVRELVADPLPTSFGEDLFHRMGGGAATVG